VFVCVFNREGEGLFHMRTSVWPGFGHRRIIGVAGGLVLVSLPFATCFPSVAQRGERNDEWMYIFSPPFLHSLSSLSTHRSMSSGAMSLESWSDKCALSLGVELNPDGTIDPSSILVTPSLVRVNYRLTYDQVDEMLDEGVGYTEEWEIGALLAAAIKRRDHRVRRGSTEGMVPYPIPKSIVTATRRRDAKSRDTSGEGKERGGEYYDISLKIETTHNSGTNMTAIGTSATTTAMTTRSGGGGTCNDAHYDPYCSPVSCSQLIVTEMMILGESFRGGARILRIYSTFSSQGTN
jgi:hypothetical protein